MSENKEVEMLKTFKEKSGWSYERMAREIGVSQQIVMQWFSGKRRPMQLSRKAINAFLIRHYEL